MGERRRVGRSCSSDSPSGRGRSWVLAQDEARALKHNYIGTEHILLGLLREEEGLAARPRVARHHRGVRAQVARIVGQGDEVTTGQIPVHAARQEGARAGAARGPLAGPQLHRDGAHPPRSRARERGRRRANPARLRCGCRRIRNEIIRMLSSPGRRQAGAGAPAGEKTKSSKLLDQFGRNFTKQAVEGSSTRSSAGRPRSSGSCRSSHAGRRTTRC